MKYYAFFLSKEDALDPRKKGFAYAKKNESEWLDISNIKDEFNTYNKGTTYMVYEDIPYLVFKDYVDYNGTYRVYICCDLGLDLDNKELIDKIFPD